MNKRANLIADKSYSFALDIVRVCRMLAEEKKEYILSKQLLRSGTAIGALVREAEHAESKRDFTHKMNIALKEANESEYWLNLLKDSGFLKMEIYTNLHDKCVELIRISASIVKTSKLTFQQSKNKRPTSLDFDFSFLKPT